MKLNSKVLFITGIDTNIGKTYATAYLMKQLEKVGYKVISQKFIQTGCKYRSEDIDLHRTLLGKNLLHDRLHQLTAPIIMSYPSSPHLAAKLDGVNIDLDKVTQATKELIEVYHYDCVLLEGAGGLMVPIKEDYLTIDYIKEQGYPVVLVTSGRLGSINHTLLSIEALVQRSIEIHSIIYNHYPVVDEVIEMDTLLFLDKYIQKKLPHTQLLSIDEINGKL